MPPWGRRLGALHRQGALPACLHPLHWPFNVCALAKGSACSAMTAAVHALQAFFNDKKKVYDISKVPDIYDSAKYDAIHNAELGLKLRPLYEVCVAGALSPLGCAGLASHGTCLSCRRNQPA